MNAIQQQGVINHITYNFKNVNIRRDEKSIRFNIPKIDSFGLKALAELNEDYGDVEIKRSGTGLVVIVKWD